MTTPIFSTQDAIGCLQNLFKETVQAALPEGKIAAFLPSERPQGKVVVVGAGKAAAAMAAELEQIWPYADVPLNGVVVTRYGHGVPTQHIRVLEASHPLPDDAGAAAAQALLDAVTNLSAEDWVIYLVSGGASALTALPAEGITLVDKQAVNRQLLVSGAPIEAMNIVRKHLSRIKGGRLAEAAAPAQVLTLAISDVVGDDISTIGSGAAVPDSSTLDDVARVVRQFSIALPEHVQQYLRSAELKRRKHWSTKAITSLPPPTKPLPAPLSGHKQKA
ncbi:glycerate-2-kinase family protein [Snodgrassella sp. CFCC 13594]|uniref:glycerate-2-kinase family protein n=1 Tax=Snodgrassella sp. CFCC 13594 TaxID=1775559 RepID=UPI000AD48E79|nr:glycerate-2-kinase family protein [Snodgrassella sp. CFCC 13594]